MKQNKKVFIFLALCFSAASQAQTSEELGRWVFDQFDLSREGFQDYRVYQHLSTFSRNKTSSKEFKQFGFQKNKGNKTLVVFEKPADNKGTALLSWHHDKGEDEQWLFLPNLKRIKKISSAGKKTPYMGSAFSYEDVAILSRQSSSGFHYNYLRTEQMNGADFHVVKGMPTTKKSAYSRIEFWVDKNNYRIPKMLFYGKKTKPVKTLTSSEYYLFLDKYWQATKTTIIDHRHKKTSKLTSKDYSFKNGLNERMFSKSGLKRIK